MLLVPGWANEGARMNRPRSWLASGGINAVDFVTGSKKRTYY